MHRNREPRLGNFLVGHGWITGEQLIRAIQTQRRAGARLGTVLLEMDLISEEKLLEALAEQGGLQGVGIEELRAVERTVLSLVPARLAVRHEVVPFAATDSSVSVAVVDPSNLAALDEIRATAGRRVLPHIATEVRIQEALQRYYEHETPTRYARLIDRLNRNRFLWDESAKILLQDAPEDGVVFSSPDDALAPTRGLIRSPSALAPGRSVGKEADGNGSLQTPGHATEPAPDPTSIEALDRELAQLTDPDSIGVAVLRFLARQFSRAAIFRISGQEVTGWLVQGEGVDREAFRALKIPLSRPSAFVGLAQGSRIHLGPLAHLPTHAAIAEVWGGELPKDCVLLPVRIKDRLVCVLYGDRGGQTLFGVDIGRLETVAQRAANALELCILRRKSRESLSGRAV